MCQSGTEPKALTMLLANTIAFEAEEQSCS